MELKETLFPYSKVRKIQDELVATIVKTLNEKNHLIVHAPTGLGKTVATLAPALAFALKKGKTIFFLTSRHTQHQIAIETLRKIKEEYRIELTATDIIGKKWMCPVPGTDLLYSGDFSEYCRAMREDNKCEFYAKTKTKSNKATVLAKHVLDELKISSPLHTEEVIKLCSDKKLCPYELSTLLAESSKVIIADYYYLFNPSIRKAFLNKIKKELEDAIIIIDEGHNLPLRVRELLTKRLSTLTIDRAIKEARKFGYDETKNNLAEIGRILRSLSSDIKSKGEKLITKQDFMQKVSQIKDYDELISEFEFTADIVREQQKASYVGMVSSFLDAWCGEDKGYVRILSKKELIKPPLTSLSYRCLDPSLISREIIESSYSTILMSGTLTPTSMYKDLLGFPERIIEKEYESPFPEKNKLNLIIPETTTKFSLRSKEQFRKIAKICSDIVNIIPGNSAVFFPSYEIRDYVYRFFSRLCKKTTFLEKSRLNKEGKKDLLERFKEYKDHGAVLLAVASGSFGEGIDLPGDLLKAVIVVGLPLQKPDLEIKELIRYYDEKFGRGWDYGYVLPAITKSLQNAGRCIRSETDKGIIIFLEERYSWPSYLRCFPKDWNIKITKLYTERIKEFFDKGYFTPLQ
jgi:DNA excision repair protein ERCC-2